MVINTDSDIRPVSCWHNYLHDDHERYAQYRRCRENSKCIGFFVLVPLIIRLLAIIKLIMILVGSPVLQVQLPVLHLVSSEPSLLLLSGFPVLAAGTANLLTTRALSLHGLPAHSKLK